LRLSLLLPLLLQESLPLFRSCLMMAMMTMMMMTTMMTSLPMAAGGQATQRR
jgi:hypothetical protein